MSESMSCWICATIESALDDIAVLLLHNRWVGLPIIAQSRRSFNATTFICRFQMRLHNLSSHSIEISDVRYDPGFQYAEAAAREGLASVLAIPLALHGRVIGVLWVYTAEPHPF